MKATTDFSNPSKGKLALCQGSFASSVRYRCGCKSEERGLFSTKPGAVPERYPKY